MKLLLGRYCLKLYTLKVHLSPSKASIGLGYRYRFRLGEILDRSKMLPDRSVVSIFHTVLNRLQTEISGGIKIRQLDPAVGDTSTSAPLDLKPISADSLQLYWTTRKR